MGSATENGVDPRAIVPEDVECVGARIDLFITHRRHQRLRDGRVLGQNFPIEFDPLETEPRGAADTGLEAQRFSDSLGNQTRIAADGVPLLAVLK
jgi:hypothetical protein